MAAVALLSSEQLSAMLEDAAERGAAKALERVQGAAGELTSEQAAAELGIAPKTLIKWAKGGRVKIARKKGNRYLFRRADVHAAREGGPVTDEARQILAAVGVAKG